jgi:Rrf2 family transcriptional regulator, cysteine metabolism repressor
MLSKAVKYAVQATVELARTDPNIYVSSRELARRGAMPERFLVQILGNLVSRDILISYQGMSGGYKLARNPETITLFDIIESIDPREGPDLPNLSGLSMESQKRIEVTLAETWKAARNELNKLTIADLVGREPTRIESAGEHNSCK